MVTSELNLARRRDPGHETRDSIEAHLDRKARSETAGHVEPPEPTSIRRRGLELHDTWQRVDARLTPCLNLKLVYGITGL
jgi:hypothetical protein